MYAIPEPLMAGICLYRCWWMVPG